MIVENGELESFWAVVPAGGAGTRLWPLSRSKRPKFLLDIAGTGRSLLQSAWDRLTPLCGDRFMLVTGAAHAEAVQQQLPALTPGNLLTEPAPRDSMAAIGLAAAVLERRDPNLILGSFPADHVIPEVSNLHDCVRQAYAAAKTGLLALIGLEPSRPTSGLGYIRMGQPIGISGATRTRWIDEFIEKPPEGRAREFVRAGGYVWNMGMWIVQAGKLMELLAWAKPQLASDLRAIAQDPECMPKIWETVERTTIDHALAEPLAGTTKICIVPGQFEWEDIGDFGALCAYFDRREPTVALHVVGSNHVVDLDSTGLVVGSTGRVVSVVGLDSVVVVDTNDALLVMSKDYAQRLKSVYNLITDSEHGLA
jgi:mannose-1-phosphate guanylyltransferase